jgi:peptide deformylase
MQYKIRYIGDPILRKPTTDIVEFDDTFRRFIKDMTEVMYKEDGIGLAAPQIGFSKSVVIVDVGELVNGEGLRVFVNPKFTAHPANRL